MQIMSIPKALLYLILQFSICTTYAQQTLNRKTNRDAALRAIVRESMFGKGSQIRPDSVFDKPLRQGDLDALLRAVPYRSDLQLERLAAYFFHQRINQYRLENGRTTLYWDDRMWLAARNHNVYMTKNNFSHEETKAGRFFTGVNPSDRIQFVMYNGFKLRLYGENILMNYSAVYKQLLVENAKNIAEESFEQWRNSPPHNQNMLDPNHFAHGTSFYRGSKSLVQIFATTNFGNESNFKENEITITWNDSIAQLYPPDAIQNRAKKH